MKELINKYGTALLLVVILVINFYYNNKIDNYNNNLNILKRKLILRDSIHFINDKHSKKLVNDTNTYDELNELIKNYDSKLSKYLVKQKSKPLIFTKISAKPKQVVDTVYVYKDTSNFKFTTYYPNKDKYFIKYSGNIINDTIIGKWYAKKIDIGIVVSKNNNGLYVADLNAPPWINVKDIKINSTNLNVEKVSKSTKLVVGANIGWNFMNKEPITEVEFGVKKRNTIYSIQSNTNKELKVGINFIF